MHLFLINILYVVDVCPLIKDYILSEATYDFQIHCAMDCLQDPFCAGYNFTKKHQKKTPNCQLTHTLDHNFYDGNADDKGWIFYHPVAPRKVRNCSKNTAILNARISLLIPIASNAI
jgi:hypothetical protein